MVIPIITLQQVREKTVEYGGSQVTGPSDVLSLFQDLVGTRDRECFLVLCLDTKNRPTALELTSVGTLDASLAHPREIFKLAIMHNSSAIVLAHNHPSGDPTPSAEDRQGTKRIAEAGQLLGIVLLDHVIVGDGRGYSIVRDGEIGMNDRTAR